MKSLEEIVKENKEADKKQKQIIILDRQTEIRANKFDYAIEIKTQNGVALITEATLESIVELNNHLKNGIFGANQRIRKIFYEEKIWG